MDIESPWGRFTLCDAEAIPDPEPCAKPSCGSSDDACMPDARHSAEDVYADMSPMVVEAILMMEDVLLHRQCQARQCRGVIDKMHNADCDGCTCMQHHYFKCVRHSK